MTIQPNNPANILIDDEFKRLLPPLDSESLAALEESLLEYGIRDALVLWKGHGILIDGHNRYEIAMNHGLPFQVIEMEFDSREEVIIWIVTNQISRRNLPPLQFSYFVGLHYRADRRIRGSQINAETGEQMSGMRQTDAFFGSTRNRLSEKYGISASTVERSARVSEGVDAIAEVSPIAKDEIITGNVKISRTKLINLSRAPQQEVSAVARSIEDGTFGQGFSDDSGQTPPGEGPATIQDLAKATTSIRRNFSKELRQLESAKGNETPATLATAKPVLRAYINSLEELYHHL
ncbi:MAG: hypothetical protein FWE26_02515 [Coriobacteriia bacterium]|nr:hypothetical protein [Coriobacteriia bacterium]